MSNRLDAIGDLVQRGPDIIVAGPLSLKLDERQDGLVVVAGPVVDFVEGVVQQFHAAFTLRRALVDFALIKTNYEEDQELGERGNDQSPCTFGVRNAKTPGRGNDRVPDE
nr:hypothetical protein [Sphingomonas sediminicola]